MNTVNISYCDLILVYYFVHCYIALAAMGCSSTRGRVSSSALVAVLKQQAALPQVRKHGGAFAFP